MNNCIRCGSAERILGEELCLDCFKEFYDGLIAEQDAEIKQLRELARGVCVANGCVLLEAEHKRAVDAESSLAEATNHDAYERAEDLLFIWKTYALEDDQYLTGDGRELKRLLLDTFVPRSELATAEMRIKELEKRCKYLEVVADEAQKGFDEMVSGKCGVYLGGKECDREYWQDRADRLAIAAYGVCKFCAHEGESTVDADSPCFEYGLTCISNGYFRKCEHWEFCEDFSDIALECGDI